MDPVARRFMWEVITDIVTKREKCSVILTTHSMEVLTMLSEFHIINLKALMFSRSAKLCVRGLESWLEVNLNA